MISRVWIRNTEGVYNGSADYTFTPVSYLAVKTGTFHQWKKRELYRRIYTVNEGDLRNGHSDYVTSPGGYGDYIDYERTRFEEQELGKVWSDEYLREDHSGLKVYDRTSGSDAYVGTQQNNSGYLSVSFTPAHRKLELYGGVRIEYDRQKVAGAIPPFSTDQHPNEPILVDIQKTSILPSLNIGLRPFRDWVLRGAYGRTLNRPEFREISPYPDRDYESNEVIQGNPLLRPATIDNYDLRSTHVTTKREKA
jgi:outer membrane receptor protein involved in Fe transport